MSESDAASLDQGGVKVKAEVGEREEKQAERGWDELSNWEQTTPSALSSCAGLGKCEWQDLMSSALESALSTMIASALFSFP